MVSGMILMAFAMTLFGCDQVTPATPLSMQKVSENLRYFKADNGLCFGVLESMGYSSYVTRSITIVPCSAVGL